MRKVKHIKISKRTYEKLRSEAEKRGLKLSPFIRFLFVENLDKAEKFQKDKNTVRVQVVFSDEDYKELKDKLSIDWEMFLREVLR